MTLPLNRSTDADHEAPALVSTEAQEAGGPQGSADPSGGPLPAIAAPALPRWLPIAAVMGILLVWLLTYVWQSGSMGLADETEPLFSEAARQMVVTGDWLTPYFNGATRFDKPPLIYWLTAIAYKILGVNEWAVRLPSGLSALAVIAAGFVSLKRFAVPPAVAAQQPWLPWLVAAIGAGTIALTPETIAWGRVGVSDMLLTGCLATALLAFFWGYASPERSQKRLGYGGFYVLVSLAILTKGPVGLVLPGLIILAFLVYLGELKQVWREANVVWGLVLIAALSVPWFAAVIHVHGQTYIDAFFGYHNLQRFTEVVNRHLEPWHFYFMVVFVGFLPWSPYIPLTIAQVQPWRRSWWQRQNRADRLGLFATFWFLGVFTFFTIAATKLPSYVLPLMPAAGLLLALLWRDLLLGDLSDRPRWLRPGRDPALALVGGEDSVSVGFRATAWLAIGFMGLLAIVLAAQGIWLPMIDDPDMPNLTEELEATGAVTRGAIIWGLATIGGVGLIVKKRFRWLWPLMFAAGLIFLLAATLPVATALDAQRQLPLRQVSAEIVRQRQTDETLIMIGFSKPSVAFYTQKYVFFSPGLGSAIAEVRTGLAQNQPRWAKSATVLVLGDRQKMSKTRLDQLGQAITAAGIYEVRRIDRQQFLAHQIPPGSDD